MAAGRKGLKTVLIEKESEIGHKIKGECIRKESQIFDTIFREGLPENVILNDISGFRFYAPNPSNYIDMPLTTTPYVTIDYRLFIVELFKNLSKTDCQVSLNTQFGQLIKDGEKVVGAICKKDNEKIRIHSKYLIAADGNNSMICQELNMFTQEEIYRAVKFNFENLEVENHEMISLYVLLDPPSVIWFFPKGRSSGELGITICSANFGGTLWVKPQIR
jgi:flavin-dependent dehydrogenase